MFKKTSVSEKEILNTAEMIDKLGAITAEQHAEFAKLSGRFDIDFKTGKPSDASVGKTSYFKVGKPSDASAGKGSDYKSI